METDQVIITDVLDDQRDIQDLSGSRVLSRNAGIFPDGNHAVILNVHGEDDRVGYDGRDGGPVAPDAAAGEEERERIRLIILQGKIGQGGGDLLLCDGKGW